MPFDLTPNVEIRRDREGRVRQLSHGHEPYRPAAIDMHVMGLSADAITPRTLAEQYLRDVAHVYGLSAGMTANLAAAPTSAPSSAPTELRFKEEKAVASTATVAYDQTHLGLPVWNAGVTVRLSTTPMQVVSSHSAIHYEVDVERPGPDAQFLPHAIAPARLAEVLGLKAENAPRVNATRLLIYLYRAEDRIDPQVRAHEDASESTGLAGAEGPAFPALPLPPVPATIAAGRHYVVTEVLFTLAWPGWGILNWRAFLEPNTGAVLYVRAFVSCVRGSVFVSDPVTLTGVLHGAGAAASVLDPIRATVPLLGLPAPTNGGTLRLAGEWVKLTETDAPASVFPTASPPYDFVYSCKSRDFAACSAYHHCDAVFRLIKGMGIDLNTYFNNTDFPVPVDPHALGGAVNAAARGNVMGNGMGAFVFGVARQGETLGIAADVRVVLHEFGHAVLWDHVDSPNFGFAHSPGDSLAAILHDPGSRAPDRFETFPFMKQSAGLSRRHDRSVASGWGWGGVRDDRQYGSEQILSTTMFRVYRAAGGDAASLDERRFIARYVAYVILKAVGLLSFTTTDPDVYVSALVDADASTTDFEGHPGGTLRKLIRWSFEKQGLYDGAPPEVDVYIDDGRGGEYLPHLADIGGTPELWNRHAPDGGAKDQAPIVGAINHAYVAVRNRGTAIARGVVVRAFQSKSPSARVWPTDWKPVPGGRIDVGGGVAPGARVVVGPIAWTPEAPGTKLLLSVGAAGDLSTLDLVTSRPVPNARLVPLDNNLAQRTMS
jgi:hypothetical protein